MLINTKQGMLKIVSSALSKFEEVDEIHEVFGRFDILIKILANDLEEVKNFIQNKLQIIDGITNSETLICS